MNAPIFAIEALTDVVVVSPPFGSVPKAESAGKTAYLNAWAANMTAALAANLKPGDGHFAPACFIHCDFYHQAPLVAGRSYDDALAAWYKGIEKPRLLDACDPKYPSCNPSCPPSMSSSVSNLDETEMLSWLSTDLLFV
jgi:hypothetical protein